MEICTIPILISCCTDYSMAHWYMYFCNTFINIPFVVELVTEDHLNNNKAKLILCAT